MVIEKFRELLVGAVEESVTPSLHVFQLGDKTISCNMLNGVVIAFCSYKGEGRDMQIDRFGNFPSEEDIKYIVEH